jgi:hypothetical protein
LLSGLVEQSGFEGFGFETADCAVAGVVLVFDDLLEEVFELVDVV